MALQDTHTHLHPQWSVAKHHHLQVVRHPEAPRQRAAQFLRLQERQRQADPREPHLRAALRHQALAVWLAIREWDRLLLQLRSDRISRTSLFPSLLMVQSNLSL
jgi:hypothetical protein